MKPRKTACILIAAGYRSASSPIAVLGLKVDVQTLLFTSFPFNLRTPNGGIPFIDNWNISDKWLEDGGISYDHDDARYDGRGSYVPRN